MPTDIVNTLVDCVFIFDLSEPEKFPNIQDITKVKDELKLSTIAMDAGIIFGHNNNTRFELIGNSLSIKDRSEEGFAAKPITDWTEYLFTGFPTEKIKAYGINFIGHFTASEAGIAPIEILNRFPISSDPVTDDELSGLSVRLFYGDLESDYYDIRFFPKELNTAQVGYQIHYHRYCEFADLESFLKRFSDDYLETSKTTLEYVKRF